MNSNYSLSFYDEIDLKEKKDVRSLLKSEISRHAAELKKIKAMIPFSNHRGVENESILKMMKANNDASRALK